MDEKTLQTLEFPKILERLAGYCAFAPSKEKAAALQPTTDIVEARRRLAETSEAVSLLTSNADLTIGGARDIRAAVDLARHGGTLEPGDLLDVKYTLVAARNLARRFERLAETSPNLADLAAQLPGASTERTPMGIIDAVSRAISDRGEILDSASDKLGKIRREQRVVHDRLLSKLQRMVADPKKAQYLQEALITQRDGRYVLPLRAEFKGRIKSIVHDQSASGATLFVEPLSVVESNNQYRELLLAERDEERRILAELSSQVGEHAGELDHAVDVIAEIDLALARANFAEDLDASAPELYPIPNSKSEIRLYQARHPLLDPETVVAVDVELDPQTYALVITGPNTGGKTVTLKTVGLLVLMAQAGLHIPVLPGSALSVFQAVYADIGDEQSIEQSLSTFSGHITNIIRILEGADRSSLVILDELGAGTDPQEGAALARALLVHLVERGITTLVTTHHPELKAFAHATPGVVNASVEFDLETLRPTYHLTIGLPGRSNALAIAQRLGLPEPVIEAARAQLSPDELRADDLLDEIHRQRDLARDARDQAEAARLEAATLQDELVERLENIEDERREVLVQAHADAIGQLDNLGAEIAGARREMVRARQPADALDALEETVESLEEALDRPVERKTPEFGPALQKMQAQKMRAIRLGDKVRLRGLGAQGVVTALSEQDVEVQLGNMRVRTRLAELEQVAEGDQAPDSAGRTAAARTRKAVGEESPAARGKLPPAESPGIELDLRGKRAEDALEALDRYLDAAYLAGMPYVRVIHGKGTGKLRQVVRQALSGHSQVKSFQPGGPREGGDGVTVATLAGN